MKLTLADRELIRCSEEEQRNLLPLIENLIDLANEVRKRGLLGLEAVVNEWSDPFTLEGIMLIIDAVDPDIIEYKLDLRIITSFATGGTLLKMLLIEDAILSIQKGCSPDSIRSILLCYLSDKIRSEALTCCNST